MYLNLIDIFYFILAKDIYPCLMALMYLGALFSEMGNTFQ